MRAAALICLAAAVVFALPSVIDRARRNYRLRKARAALVVASSWLDDLIEEALEEGAGDDYRICRDIERAEGWIA